MQLHPGLVQQLQPGRERLVLQHSLAKTLEGSFIPASDNVTLRGSQQVTALNKKHLVQLANTVYTIDLPLAMSSLLADLITSVKEA